MTATGIIPTFHYELVLPKWHNSLMWLTSCLSSSTSALVSKQRWHRGQLGSALSIWTRYFWNNVVSPVSMPLLLKTDKVVSPVSMPLLLKTDKVVSPVSMPLLLKTDKVVSPVSMPLLLKTDKVVSPVSMPLLLKTDKVVSPVSMPLLKSPQTGVT